MADGRRADGIAIGRAASDCGDADIAAGAAAVLDDEWLAKYGVQPFAEDAREDVGRAAGWVRQMIFTGRSGHAVWARAPLAIKRLVAAADAEMRGDLAAALR